MPDAPSDSGVWQADALPEETTLLPEGSQVIKPDFPLDGSDLKPTTDKDLCWRAEGGRDHLAHRVILVRHGRTRYNLAHRIQGMINIPLDEHGKWQARETGKALRALYVDSPEAKRKGLRQFVVASDLTRAAQTAHAFADPIGVQVHLDKRIRERYFGGWEGVSVEERAAKWPEDRGEWNIGEGPEIRHGAEAKVHVGQRGGEALNDWVRSVDSHTDLYYFSHGSHIASVVAYLLGKGTDGIYDNIDGLRNAFWAILRPAYHDDGTYRWHLEAYNLGPTVAQQTDWDGGMSRIHVI